MSTYDDLFDIEQRPGGGIRLWTVQLRRQLERVRDANYRYRLSQTPDDDARQEDPGVEDELHGEVYFLVLTVRRVLLFVEALERQVDDPRLSEALEFFHREAPGVSQVRNLFEHVDEYLLDRPGKHMKQIEGRISPVLICRWDADNVVVAYGPGRFDVTLAADAGIRLGETALAVWEAELDRAKAEADDEPVPDTDDGIPRAIQIEIGAYTIIERSGGGPEVNSGRLRAVRVREISEAEAERLRALEDQAPDQATGPAGH